MRDAAEDAFQDPTLRSAASALAARSKTFRHRFQSYSVSEEWETDGDESVERLNCDLTSYDSPPIQIRLSLWAGGELLLRACQSGGTGWRFNITTVGHVFASVDMCEVVELLLETPENLVGDDFEILGRIRRAWRGVATLRSEQN